MNAIAKSVFVSCLAIRFGSLLSANAQFFVR
jgi:hypothetical protein